MDLDVLNKVSIYNFGELPHLIVEVMGPFNDHTGVYLSMCLRYTTLHEVVYPRAIVTTVLVSSIEVIAKTLRHCAYKYPEYDSEFEERVGSSSVYWHVHSFPICGAVVAERSARSPSTKASRAQSPAGLPIYRMWESCRTMPLAGGFPRGSPVSPALSFRCCSILTLFGSEDLAFPICCRENPFPVQPVRAIVALSEFYQRKACIHLKLTFACGKERNIISEKRRVSRGSLWPRNRIRLERASQKQSSDTHKTPYDRVKRCRERKINIKASEHVNVDSSIQLSSPAPQSLSFFTVPMLAVLRLHPPLVARVATCYFAGQFLNCRLITILVQTLKVRIARVPIGLSPTRGGSPLQIAARFPQYSSALGILFRSLKRGKNDTATCFKCVIATKRKALNRRAVFLVVLPVPMGLETTLHHASLDEMLELSASNLAAECTSTMLQLPNTVRLAGCGWYDVDSSVYSGNEILQRRYWSLVYRTLHITP
ncbi:hypothetical protein PR048_030009 [Dryococelus australis]|uniref:Uncharacterized protein n=1 Tax=Dryococelus australis TaxID=614101 RepID=A0ABQ9GAE0_9NEOP|nr:hypothetical protein PR048_030009 [Dryococelus australis]